MHHRDMASLPVWSVGAEFDWLLQANGSEIKNTHDNFHEAWSEDSMCQVQWKSDNLGDNQDFDQIQNGTNDVIG